MQFIDLKTQQFNIKEKIKARIDKVLSHGKYIMGPEVFELEDILGDYVGVKHCISCSSGTDALLIPLMAKGIGPGDAVITTPFTYIATGEVISLLGATPIFSDICPKTFNIDPNSLENSIEEADSKGLKAKAIIPVDLFGLPANYDKIEKFATKNKLFILEDAAQGFGGTFMGNKAGSFGNAAATSFFPAKPLGCYGDGGAIFTNDDNLSKLMKSIRVHGSGANKYDNIRIGLNGRLDTLQAAILLEKIKIFDPELDRRNEIAKYFRGNLPEKFRSQFVPKNFSSSWAQFSIVAESMGHRDRVLASFKNKGIPVMIYYGVPLHLQSVFKSLNYCKGSFPNSENIANRIFSIPMHPYLEKNSQDIMLEILTNV